MSEQKRSVLVMGIVSVLLAMVMFVPGLATAGELEPSAPPGPTMKTLDELEPRTPISSLPFRVDNVGSYYLTGNLVGTPDKDGISIRADNVTLDLNGFALIGVDGTRNGVYVPVECKNLAIRNGTVSNWGRNGVLAEKATNGQVQHLRLSSNGIRGLWIGSGSSVSKCTASDNSSRGILANDGSTVSNCVASNNGDNGITVGNGSLVSNCMTSDNGRRGIEAGDGSTVSNCIASDNGFIGIKADEGNTISNCTVSNNGSNGIKVDQDSTIVDCTVVSNSGDGILVTRACRVVENICNHNNLAGIHVIGGVNRVEGNLVSGNYNRGIVVEDTWNVIIKNLCNVNHITNFDIADGNTVGPIRRPPEGPWDNIY